MLPERIFLELNEIILHDTRRIQWINMKIYSNEKIFTFVNVDASTNSCELSEISVKPTSSRVKIIH
jgi:hypothetical protein